MAETSLDPLADHTVPSEAMERVLEAAERLFAERGYKAVTLRDIAAEIGIRHTSLYHHVPGGKEELFIRVTERSFNQHRMGLYQAIANARPDLRSQLYTIADWLIFHPPMDLTRMVFSDMPSIDPEQAERLSNLAYASLLQPIDETLRAAISRHEIAHQNPGLIAGAILGMVESVHSVPDFAVQRSRQAMAHEMLDTLLTGLFPRE